MGPNVNDLVTALESNASGFNGSFGTAGTIAAIVPVLVAEGAVESKIESGVTLEDCGVVVRVEDVEVGSASTVMETLLDATAFAGIAKLTFSAGSFPVARTTVEGNAVNTLVETALSTPPDTPPLIVVSNVEKPVDCKGGKNLGPSVTVLDMPSIGVAVVVPRSKEVVVAVNVNDFEIAEKSNADGCRGSLGTAGTIATTVLLFVEVVEEREDEVIDDGLVVGIVVEVAGGVSVDRLLVEDEDDG